jgi:hypothetical protein
MKKSLIALAALVAGTAMAQTLTVSPAQTQQWLECDAKLHGNWNSATCQEARERLSLRQTPITVPAMQAEMKKVDEENTRAFIRNYNAGGPNGGAIKTRR